MTTRERIKKFIKANRDVLDLEEETYIESALENLLDEHEVDTLNWVIKESREAGVNMSDLRQRLAEQIYGLGGDIVL